MKTPAENPRPLEVVKSVEERLKTIRTIMLSLILTDAILWCIVIYLYVKIVAGIGR